MANFAENFLSTFVPGFSSGFQRAEAKRAGQQQADIDAKQLRDRERLALFSTVGENIKSGTMTGEQGNRLLSALFPEFKQTTTTAVQKPTPAFATPPVAVTEQDIGAGRGPIMAQPELKLKTEAQPAAIFQDKPVTAEKKLVDPVLTEAGQTIFKLYQEGKVPESAVREFLPSYQEAVRTGDFSKLKLPSALTESTALSEKEKAELARIKQQTSTSLTQQKLDEARLGQIGTEKPLTPSQKATQTRQFANDVERSKPVQQFKTIRLQAYKTNKILDDVNNKLARGVKQEVALVAFQKALDEISAAREGEVARTIGMQGFLDQVIAGIRGAISGGKLTDETVNSLREAMNIFGATAQKFANDEVTKGRDRGASFGLDADQIAKPYKDFPEALESGAPATTTPAAPTTGPNRYKSYIRQNLK